MGNNFFMGVAALAAAGSVFGASNDRLSSDEKGSLLIFSNVIGTMHMSNDYPADVALQAYVVDYYSCESYDMGFSLTANQIASFTSDELSAPFGDSGPVSMYVWAVNGDNAQIRWNHLSGGVIGNGGGYAAARALIGNNGDTVGEAGTINMDGAQYASPFDSVAYNFVAGSDLLSIELLDRSFADKTDFEANTKIVAEIWNADEVKFSGTSACVYCRDVEELNDWSDSAVNFFRSGNLGTDLGKARLSTQANPSCDIDVDNDGFADIITAEHAFMATSLFANGSVAGMGSRSATITYEPTEAPEEAGKVRKAFGLLRK